MSWRQGPDGHWYPPPPDPRANQQGPVQGTSRKPEGGDDKKDSRSFAERVTTAQAILAIIVSLIALGGSALVAIKHFTTHAPQGVPISQAKAALLTSSDLALIDTNLVSGDIQIAGSGPGSGPGSCKPTTVASDAALTREFSDSSNGLVIIEEVQFYRSSNDANIAVDEDSQSAICRFDAPKQFPPTSITNISGRLAGLCADGAAWALTAANGNANLSSYFGIVRCGRVLVFFTFDTRQGSSFDKADTLATGMSLAVPKIEDLPTVYN